MGVSAQVGPTKPSSAPLETKLKEAGPDVEALAERLRALAERLGIRAVPAPNSLRLEDEFREGTGAVLSLYPTQELVHFIFPRIIGSGQAAAVGRLRDGLAAIAGKGVAQEQPSLQCKVALEQWDKFEPLVSAYVEERQRA